MSESPEYQDSSESPETPGTDEFAGTSGSKALPNRSEDAPGTYPTVQPPSATFILQLFVIPLVIVSIIVMVWLMFSWLAHMGSNPRDMVQDLKKLDEVSWQRALTLADVLRNSEYDELKDDTDMSGELAAVLQEQLDAVSDEEQAIKLRMFLCRALGEFRTANVIPVLVTAANPERESADLDVCRAALQALAVYTSHQDGEYKNRDKVLKTVLEASRARSDGGTDKKSYDELRSTAAFVLGVLGGTESLDRLALMLNDAHANTRYNAALGLARQGDGRSIPLLLEMLDPANDESAENEPTESAKSSKRLAVIKNGIQGAAKLAERNPQLQIKELISALEAVIDSKLPLFHARVRHGIRIRAQETLLIIRARKSGK
jgi:HEAT repeat protein